MSLAVAGLGLAVALSACGGGAASSTPAMAPHSLAPNSITAGALHVHPNTVTVTPTHVLFKLGNKKVKDVFVQPSSDFPYGLQSNCTGIAKITPSLYNALKVKPLSKNGKCTLTITDNNIPPSMGNTVNLPITNHSN